MSYHSTESKLSIRASTSSTLNSCLLKSIPDSQDINQVASTDLISALEHGNYKNIHSSVNNSDQNKIISKFYK